MPKVESDITTLSKAVARVAEESFLELLQTKHLYQSISIDFNNVIKTFKEVALPKIKRHSQDYWMNQLFYFVLGPWFIVQNKERRPLAPVPPDELIPLSITLPTIKAYCKNCKRLEPYNPQFGEDAIFHSHDPIQYSSGRVKAYQIFSLSYQCQSCKSVPEVFLVTRKEHKVTLCGRSEIEHIPVPPDIPSLHSKHYSSSILAHNSGQTLAAIFFLRVFIEQYVYSLTEDKDLKVDKVLEQYNASIPEDLKTRIPSLPKLWSDLSAAIHRANDSDSLFEDVREKIIVHFEAKRLFKLS